MSYLSIEHVNKIYPNGCQAVKDFNLEVEENDFIVILGPSGCGKSTMLRMICGLEGITSGKMILDGVEINKLSPKDRNIAMVFQNYALYGHMSVYDNIGFSEIVRKSAPIKSNEENSPREPKRRVMHTKVMKAAEIVKITDDQLNRKPAQLSGGQRQRVALGRAIVRDAKLYLMDEPLSNLDAKLRGGMRVEIMDLHKNYNQTIIYVSHDQVEAMTMATKIVLMNNSVIEQIGAPIELYKNPNNLFVATFLGTPQMNLIEGKLLNGEFVNDKFKIELPEFKGMSRDNVILGIRCEDVHVTDESPDFTGEITHVEFLGQKTLAYLDYNGSDIIASSKKPLADGVSSCGIRLSREDIVLFDKETTNRIRGERSEG